MTDKTDIDVVVQVAQRVVNLRRAVHFYQRLLGQPADVVFDPSGLALFVLDRLRTRLLLDREAASSLVYLRVDDVCRRVEELRADGVVVEGEPSIVCQNADPVLGKERRHEWRAFVRDTEGNTVGLVSAAAAGA
ncbi:methylmalonyl-CoA epimerase [Cellulomonas cellasea]|uniref:VOC family protein n=1 Tax=Cellulomonas cellasea TaxID=43670 RepID=UPI0025A45A58|nr:methylmalonyl-CoA epimerase [Cellulomonas cellasea]MDM8084415.1 methylmalonyl-CoA epimerase [Cellulomonas cellasea]